MVCQKCNSNLAEGTKFCQTCGAEIPVEANVSENTETVTTSSPAPQQPQNFVPVPQQPYNFVQTVQQIPPAYKPISAWGYLGYMLLFAIPLVGFILLIVFSFSDNINLRNFARSYWCAFLVGIILVVLLGIVVAAIGGAIFSSML